MCWVVGMSAGGGIWTAFRRFVLNRDAGRDSDLRKALEQELQTMDNYLEEHRGPFFGRESFSLADAALLPCLYRMKVALGHFKEWKIPDTYSRVEDYLEQATHRASFQKTTCSDAEVINGWKQYLRLD